MLEDGLACGLHRIERLVRQNTVGARPKRRGKPKGDGERSVIAGDSLGRGLQTDRPNPKRLAGFAHTWTAGGWLYASVVPDLFSRRVVGRSVEAGRDAPLVTGAPMTAIRRRGKADALLHRSGQGSRYTGERF